MDIRSEGLPIDRDIESGPAFDLDFDFNLDFDFDFDFGKGLSALRTHRRSRVALVVACGFFAAACGGSSGTSGSGSVFETVDSRATANISAPEVTTVPEPTTVVVTEAPTDTQPNVDTVPITTPTEPGAGSVNADAEATWSGGDFVLLAGTRMDELGAVFGQPATAASLAPTFVLPDDFPYPGGSVVGTFHTFERDLRITDGIAIDEERIVGVDGVGDAATFDAITAGLEADATTRWGRASSQRDQIDNDLFTALPLDGGESKDRLILRGPRESGGPPSTFGFEITATEIPTPSWQAGLPILDGGEATTLREGRGQVEASGRLAEDGQIELRFFYPLERYDELEAFFASGVIAAAGFEYQDTPFSNYDIRLDVANGDWSGTVGVGSVSVNNEDIGYQLIWSLTRPVS